MTEADKIFAGSIPEIYDRYLVPLIFDSYALDLAERVAESGPQEVLEVAAGTGALTRTMASRLPACVHIVATDLNQPMLDHAKARQSQFGVMFFPDKIQGYKEARRILKPGGRFLFNVWDRISENEFADVVNEALTVFFPRDPPCFMARTPHGYHDVERVRVELNAAGFSKISVEAVDDSSEASSPLDPAIAFCQGTPLRNEIESRDASGLEDATKHAAEALARRFGSGAIEGRIRAFVITAIR
jgi:ubiquinone/menaquinone biosynthesis C-methylase UbiE